MQGAVRRSSGGRASSVAIVVRNFHRRTTNKLPAGSIRGLVDWSVRRNAVHTCRRQGTMVSPQAANLLRLSREVDASVCQGAVIRRGTPHFEYVSTETAREVREGALRTAIPVTLGALTTDTLQHAICLTGGFLGNKGCDVAEAAVDRAMRFREFQRRLSQPPKRRG